MLIQCPKCGFSQPKDRYCANCGVDMESYRPQKPPLMGRIVGSAFFQISFVFLIVFVAIFYIRQKQKEELASRVEFLKGGPLIVEKTFTPNPPAQAESSPPPVATAEAPPPPPPPPPTQATVPASAAMAMQTPPAVSDKAKNPSQNTLVKMHLLYAEVDKVTMDMLRQESQATGQYTDFGDFKAGAIPATRKVTRERGVRILHREEKNFTQANPSQNWLTGPASANGEFHLGFSSAAAVEVTQKGLIKGEIEIHHTFHENNDPNEPPVSRPYPSTSFELNPGMSWMMSLSVPPVQQEEPGKTESDGIMRIFQSPQFKSGRTEFTLFIEFDTSSPK
jgi:hypothetical protein